MSVLVGLLLSVPVFAFCIFAFWRFYRQRKLGEALLLAEGDVLLHDALALIIGDASGKVGWLRTNGALALSRQELVFVQWIPERVVRIARADIVAVEVDLPGARTFTVVHRSNEGEKRTAFQVYREPEGWLAELRSTVSAREA